jgi:hypothetical protein
MGLPPALNNVKMRLGMYFPKIEFNAVAAFVDGFNLATNGGLLVGFREWLVVRLGYGNNLRWEGLVLRLTFPETESPGGQLHRTDNQNRAVQSLFTLLEAFLQERESADSLRRIFLRYEGWLKRQDWYGPTSPQWIANEEIAEPHLRQEKGSGLS